LEPDWLVKAGLEFTHWPVHQNHCRAFIHAQDTAKPVVKAENVPGAKPESSAQWLPNDAEKLGLVRVGGIVSCVFHNNPPGQRVFKP